jgi:hypothetical protein
MIMYGKAPKMSSPKMPAKKAAAKPRPLPQRGQRAMTNKMTRGKK